MGENICTHHNVPGDGFHAMSYEKYDRREVVDSMAARRAI